MNNFNQTKAWLFMAFTGFLLISCGNSPSSTAITPTTAGTGVSGSLPPSLLTVSKSITTAIAATGTVVVTATVVDADGASVADGTNVLFETDIPGTSITSSALTVSGVATATFNANNVAGTATITATAGSATGFTTIQILASTPASVSLVSSSPAQIGVKGAGLAETAILTFKVSDATGNPVTDGTTINFSIGNALGGGETISPTTTDTVSGVVSVTLTAGNKSGLIGIVATEPISDVATTGSVVVLGGQGIASNFSMETNQASFEGFDRIGNTNDFKVFLADIFGNPIKEGTPVTFITELGSIPSATVNVAGIATTTYTTPGGNDPGSVLRGHPLGAGTGKTGYLTVLAMAPGQEPFSDNNNNGIYDAGDTFTVAQHDFGEPFLDANENGVHDVGEQYNDTNADGLYSGPNGVHDKDTVIWVSMVVVLSTKSYTMTPVGGPTSYVVTIVDANNNPVDASSTYTAALSFTAPGSPGTITGVGASNLPFGVSYALVTPGSPVVPIWVPTFVNNATTSHLAGDVMSITTTTPSSTLIIDGL